MDQRLVVGLAGMPGSGKSIAVVVAKGRDYAVVVMGDVVREETENRGLSLTPENMGNTMLILREKEGPTAISRRCIPKITGLKENRVLVDGIRSLEEVEDLRRHFPQFNLIAIHSSPETRFRRLYNRRRSDDPANWNTFMERDMRELNVGLGNAIAMSDFVVVNEGKMEEIQEDIARVLQRIESTWTKLVSM